jgi:ubiquitin C-terminal hydrolase
MPPYSQDSALAAQEQPSLPAASAPPSRPPPMERHVATGVANLGNTCYMNAVLQALAHCQELNMAMDVAPHSATCPIAQSRKNRASPSPPLGGTRKSTRNGKKSPSPSASSYCALCEFEALHQQVHSMKEAVAPSAFVHGFIDHVAPWFKLGVQEDSHEFLRLLIDAMQKCCIHARSSLQSQDDEYPFQLFRGTVESKVQCESCHACSSTIDPIEDIGLDVSSHKGGGGALADVSSAFTKFKAQEVLEGYKCEKCGKTGKATKQTRLASIPPILTLHLKRFRYGTSSAEEGSARRRSEISQLLARDVAASKTGKSGSAKIEGHVKFEQFFDLMPFLTESLKEHHKTMFCRLFAVIVHAGANSHSGHYIAYVQSLSKKEWWKMDDARISRVTEGEVMNAEAYMLFYRVVEHPTLVALKEQHRLLVEANTKKEHQQQQGVVESSDQHQGIDSTADTLTVSPDKKRKRDEVVKYLNGEEWALTMTQFTPALRALLRRGEEFVADNAEFEPHFFALVEEAAKKERGPPVSPLKENDILGGLSKFNPLIKELLYRIYESNPTKFFKSQKHNEPKKNPALIVAPPVLDQAESVL